MFTDFTAYLFGYVLGIACGTFFGYHIGTRVAQYRKHKLNRKDNLCHNQ